MRRSMTLAAPAVALLAVTIARAETITFRDVNDVVSVSTTGTRFIAYPSGVGLLAFGALFAPTGGAFASSTIPNLTILGTSVFPTFQYSDVFSDPTGKSVSDVFGMSDAPNSPSTFILSPLKPFPAPLVLFFEADIDASPIPCRFATYGCQGPANGTIQTIGTVTWDLRTGSTVVDTIRFQVAEVPEPSLRLMLALLLVFGAAGVSRLAANQRIKLRR